MEKELVVPVFNILDVCLIFFCSLSALMGFWRGLTREVSSVTGWAGAGLAAVYTFPTVQRFARSYIDNYLIADLIAGGSIFFLFLFIFSLMGEQLSLLVKKSFLNSIDRSLGLGFGVVRGVLLTCCGYLILLLFLPSNQHPDFLTGSRSQPWLKEGARKIKDLIPREILRGWKEPTNVEEQTAEEAVQALSAPPPKK